ncbi:MAG TPA: glycosyltransferase family 4 protein [Terriglobia bacterium]|nr:glycosyltransferase family 4 protein [Terriglobia bacterium]
MHSSSKFDPSDYPPVDLQRHFGGSINQSKFGTNIGRIAVLGNHVPRRCGIATFTNDLSEAISAQVPGLDCFVVAMTDGGQHYAYPPAVRFEIPDAELPAYIRAADFLNVNEVEIVCVQHEYGIFGGKAGNYLLALLRELRMPIVTTLHTILERPSPTQKTVMDEVTELSERLIVMSDRGAALLQSVHGVPKRKIDNIPHGVPSFPSPIQSKDLLGVEGKAVILTFGLLSPDKGIEHVIDALPGILAHHPNSVYMVVGVTHPHVKAQEGEIYRLMLMNRAQRLGVDGNIIFHDRFVSQAELTRFLSAADIYITPYLKIEQITSGTLAYAVGAGKAVISTPYWYASELLADGRGLLVPWRDAKSIGREVSGLLSDDEKRRELGARAEKHGRNMAWPIVAASYLDSFNRARVEHGLRRRSAFQAQTLARRPADLPEVRLDHLRVMTDDTGILQHATFNVPRYVDGYCLDDNARALLVMALVEEAGTEDPKIVRALKSRYLGFMNYAFDQPSGRFRNFMSYSRNWMEDCGSEDSQGRSVWALGTILGRSKDPGPKGLSDHLFRSALRAVPAFSSPRAWAYTLLGLDEYLRAFHHDEHIESILKLLSERLLELYRRASTPDFPWFEDRLTYCNARLPQALLVSGAWLKREEMMAAALRSLAFLVLEQTSAEGYFAPIGANGFYVRGGPRAAFDQQPIEACGMISACLEAEHNTGDPSWAERARWAFNWFIGENQLKQPLYDPRTGGCRDGLHEDRVNENQGAESSLCFLNSLLEMRAAYHVASVDDRVQWRPQGLEGGNVQAHLVS